jgi:RNA polymerase sigma factor (sigma-70 family)
LFRSGTLTGLPDDRLLDRFRDRAGSVEEAEAAFAVLVERYGPMVLHVCHGILGDRHDAEDAAQAVFLVLARNARSIRRTESLASWMYGVATRIAARARVAAARRRARERRGAEMASARRCADPGDGPSACPELYEELGRLPDRFRLPVVLCHLEGLTYEQAAGRLGCPVRTVQSRLARARARLRDRLVRRGVAPALVLAPLGLSQGLAPGAGTVATVFSESWIPTTVQAVVRGAASGASAAIVPATVAALAKRTTRAMILHRLGKWAASVVLVGAAAGSTGLGMLAWSAPAQPATSAPTELASSTPSEPAASALSEPEPRGTGVAVDNPYRVSFQHGATIEVVGVSTVPTGPHTWWKPDGSPLAEAPVDRIESQLPPRQGQVKRVILLRVFGLHQGDLFRWLPTRNDMYSGSQPRQNGRLAPELEYYEATFPNDLADCGVQARIAAGDWTTEASGDGAGKSSVLSNRYQFHFGMARPHTRDGRPGTAIAVAQNIFGRERRLVAIDRDGQTHTPVSLLGGGDGGEVLTLLDAEFLLPPDQIASYEVQSRPFERAEIKDIALNPRAAGKPAPKGAVPQPETRPAAASSSIDPTADTDGDGLTDFQELHKYRTDPRKFSTAGDGVSDGDWRRRREFTYTIRSVVKVMPPVNLECLDDDYQDARVRHRGERFVELEVIHYPLNTNAAAIRGNPDWRREAALKEEFLRPGITTNWDAAMRRDLVAALTADGIDPDRLDDKELVERASAWLLANSKYVNMFCAHYIHFLEGRAAIYPGLEARFETDKGNRAWTVNEQLDHELFGRAMFANRTHGSCTSTAVFLATALRALGIPTRMVLGIPLVDGNDPAQLAMVQNGIHHHRVRRTLVQGLSSARGYANHTFNEVYVGGRWVRLNDRTLGQNTLDAHLMGLLTHVNTFNDLSEVPLAATWGRRYALGERDDVFRYGNPYRCEELADHFGRFARVDNPEVQEHRALTISRAYWADDLDADATIQKAKWLFHDDGSKSLVIHAEEWFDDEPGNQYRPFLQAAGKEFLLRADGRPDVQGRITTSSITWPSRNLREIEVLIPRKEYARMEPAVEYALLPRNEVPGYEWKIPARVTIRKKP